MTLETPFDPAAPPLVACPDGRGAIYVAIHQASLQTGELTYTRSEGYIEVGTWVPYVGCIPGLDTGVNFHMFSFAFTGPLPPPPFPVAEVLAYFFPGPATSGAPIPTTHPDTGFLGVRTRPGPFGGPAFSVSPAAITTVLHMSIAIKPGTPPPVPLNLEGHGTIPVAILSSATFDARTVDPSTVTLAGAPVKRKPNGTLMWSFEDVNGDGFIDMVVHVAASDLQLTETDTEAKLEGKTVDGSIIRGSEAIQIVP